MKSKAQRVYRWVERMNAENADIPEYSNYPQHFFADDEIPSTLQAILDFIGKDFLPELKCTVSNIDDWLTTNSVEQGLCVTEKPRIKSLRQMDYPFRGVTVNGMVIPYQLTMLQRITDFFAECNASDKALLDDFYTTLGLQDWLSLKASRRVERINLIEVWGQKTA